MAIEKFAKQVVDSVISPLISAAKVLLCSRRPSDMPPKAPSKPLIVMGNGPSLRGFLDYALDGGESFLNQFDLAAVNFAVITPEFFTLRPSLYILADPHFFKSSAADEKVERLWENLRSCDWPLALWLPLQHRRDAERRLEGLPSNIELKWMNLTPIEGQGIIADYLLDSGLGMPRPRNVLIPAIMTGLRSGYSRIYIVGADHSWSRTLWVDDDNHVVSVQPHFYKDDEKERKRVEAEYAGYHLHDILQSLTIAFRSYFEIKRFAERRGCRIINATPQSFIDAFPRCDYAQMTQQ